MSKADPQLRKDAIQEELLQALPSLDGIIRAACIRCHHYPAAEQVKRLKQRLIVRMLEDDYRRLRTFDQRAELQTWLQTVANRLVSRLLQQERRKISLADAPSEVFTQHPVQEESLLKKEHEEALTEALGKLTPREQKLFKLLREGYKSKEIAQVLNIKVESVYRKRNALVKKIQEIIEGGG